MNDFSSNRIMIDWDDFEANGLRCPSGVVMDGPPPTGLLAEVVGPYLRERARYRRILLTGVLRSLPAPWTPWQRDRAWKLIAEPFTKLETS